MKDAIPKEEIYKGLVTSSHSGWCRCVFWGEEVPAEAGGERQGKGSEDDAWQLRPKQLEPGRGGRRNWWCGTHVSNVHPGGRRVLSTSIGILFEPVSQPWHY